MTDTFDRAVARVRAGERIDRADATALWNEADDATLSELATLVRARFHPPDRATYLVMAIVNYTNVCVARCDYCAFYKFPGEAGTYLLSFEELVKRIDVVAGLGGQLVGFNGGFHPDLSVADYAELFRRLHAHYGERLAFYEMTIAEFMFVAKRSRVSYADAVAELRAAGVQWITGGGAEVLDDGSASATAPESTRSKTSTTPSAPCWKRASGAPAPWSSASTSPSRSASTTSIACAASRMNASLPAVVPSLPSCVGPTSPTTPSSAGRRSPPASTSATSLCAVSGLTTS